MRSNFISSRLCDVWRHLCVEVEFEIFEFRLSLMSFWWQAGVRGRVLLMPKWRDRFILRSLHLFVAIAGADGKLRPPELARMEAIIRELFPLSSAEHLKFLRTLNDLRHNIPSVEQAARDFAALFRFERYMREQMLILLLDIAHADRHMSPEEANAIETVRKLFRLPHSAFERVKTLHAEMAKLRRKVELAEQAAKKARIHQDHIKFDRTFAFEEEEDDAEDTTEQKHSEQRPQAPDAYSILGCKHGAPISEVKKAYRTLVMACHPDRLAANVTAEFKRAAEARFREVTLAYDEIRAGRVV